MAKDNFLPEDIRTLQLNPLLAAKVILNLDFPPHERIRINGRKLVDGTQQGGLWWSKWFLDHSGRDTAKTHNNAVVAALRCCLFPNRTTIILSHKFSVVSEGYFSAHFQKWYDQNPLFKKQVRKIHTKPDKAKIIFKNGSEILGLPTGLMRECVSLRGWRSNDIFLDEWVHYSDQDLISDVIIPIGTKENLLSKDIVNSDPLLYSVVRNHIVFTSTPGYKFEPAYQRIKYFHAKKQQHPKNFDWQTWNYSDIPPEWDWIIDRDIFEDARENLPGSIFKMEWLGQWADFGESFYNPELIQQIRMIDNNVKIKLLGDTDKFYVLGVDVAGPEGRSDFTVCVIEIDIKTETDSVIYFKRQKKVDVDEASGILHQITKRFSPTIIMCDPSGGGTFLAKRASKKTQMINNEEVECVPILESTEWGEGKPILYFFSARLELIKKNFGEYDDAIINIAHNKLQSAIEKRQLVAPNEASPVTNKEEEEVLENINQAFKELIGVQLQKGRDGTPQKTARGYYTFLGHRCSAYAIVYAKVAAFLFRKLQESINENNENNKYVTMCPMEEDEERTMNYF
ncbi:hypothetical protein KKG41_01075 [Patescibacteria group bacterium]|nr:hypothetical protein [Patescibacteria group bacterium]MBU1871146.1 hypothetical protein [Patescibacteria group bacterium]